MVERTSKIEALVEGARQELRSAASFRRDRIEIVVGGFFREPLFQSEEFLEGIVQPEAGRGSAKQIVVAGEDAPDFPRILQLALPDSEIVERNALAVEHAKDVVIGLHEQCRRIRKRLVRRKPCRAGMPVRTDDGQSRRTCS